MEASLPPLPPGLALAEPVLPSGPPPDFSIILPAQNDEIIGLLDEDVMLPDGRIVRAGATCISKVEYAMQAKWDGAGFWRFKIAIFDGPLAWVMQHNQPAAGKPFIWSIIPDAASSDS